MKNSGFRPISQKKLNEFGLMDILILKSDYDWLTSLLDLNRDGYQYFEWWII